MASLRLRYHFDEHIPHAVAKALRRLGIDVTTSIDAGLRQAPDEAHLEYARRTGRVMVTYDPDYLQLHNAGTEHSGIVFVVLRSRSIGRLIEYLYLYYEIYLPDDVINRLDYL